MTLHGGCMSNPKLALAGEGGLVTMMVVRGREECVVSSAREPVYIGKDGGWHEDVDGKPPCQLL